MTISTEQPMTINSGVVGVSREGTTSHHETLKLVVAAVKDLQNATGILVERIGVAVDRPDVADWWKGDD
jgi:hypothetical protein